MNLHRSSNGLHALDLRPCKVVANCFVVLQSNYTNQGSYKERLVQNCRYLQQTLDPQG